MKVNPKPDFCSFVGDMGRAWGLPETACRVHAYLYLHPAGTVLTDVAEVLVLSESELSEACEFLTDYELAWTNSSGLYFAHADPWEAMLKGLDQRRRRDLPKLRAQLEACAAGLAQTDQKSAAQVDKMIGLVSDLSAIQAQTFRISPGVLRGLIGISGRAARLFGAKA